MRLLVRFSGKPLGGRMVTKRELKQLHGVANEEGEIFAAFRAAKYEKRLITLPTSGQVINTLSFGNTRAPAVVILHGWGAGAGVFASNVGPLSATHRVHLVDWLGCGGSSRPRFNRRANPDEAEKFFLDALHEWTVELRKLEPSFQKFHLVGHSLGGYLSACYACLYPQEIRKLILLSPVGVPSRPQEALWQSASLRGRLMIKTMKSLWNANVTPQSIARVFGSNAVHKLSRSYVKRRFPTLTEDQASAFANYFARISLLPGSGEYALNTILEFGAYARRPLQGRLHEVQIPVCFVYGDTDWMDWKPASALIPSLNAKSSLKILPDSGHYLFVDNPRVFNDWLVSELTL